MTSDDLRRLYALRHQLRGSGLFAFERSGNYYLYRETDGGPGRNTLVKKSKNIDELFKAAKVAKEHK